MNNKYKLDENYNPILCDDLYEWAEWFENFDRHIACDYVMDKDGREIKISTVFLGLDHAYGNDKPVLWETMIFGGDHDQYQDRYTSKQDALNGHKEAINMVKG